MKKTEIKTKRMLLRPMTDEEIETLTARLSAGSASRASDRINIDFISGMYNTPPRFPLLLGTGAVYCIYARRL